MAAKRNAQVVAVTLEVHCPHCGDPQPNPDDGSHLWSPDMVAAMAGDRICNACDDAFRIVYQKKVLVQGNETITEAA